MSIPNRITEPSTVSSKFQFPTFNVFRKNRSLDWKTPLKGPIHCVTIKNCSKLDIHFGGPTILLQWWPILVLREDLFGTLLLVEVGICLLWQHFIVKAIKCVFNGPSGGWNLARHSSQMRLSYIYCCSDGSIMVRFQTPWKSIWTLQTYVIHNVCLLVCDENLLRKLIILYKRVIKSWNHM